MIALPAGAAFSPAPRRVTSIMHEEEETLMKRQISRTLSVFVAAAAAAFAVQPLQAKVLESSMLIGRTVVHYKTVLPDTYDPAKAYPAVVALGGGPQTMDTVNRILDRNFRAEAEKREYIVVAPAAPDGEYFFDTADRIFPAFLQT